MRVGQPYGGVRVRYWSARNPIAHTKKYTFQTVLLFSARREVVTHRLSDDIEIVPALQRI
jgi:hypothetical protein